MREIIRYIMMLFVALSAASCIYPFEPEGIDEEVGLLVMEGDINIGNYSTFTPSTSLSLLNEKERTSALRLSAIYVEDESGKKYDRYERVESADERFLNNIKLSYRLDTRLLDKSQRHRLVFDYDGERYSTEWLEYVPTPEIDSVTWKVVEVDGFKQLNLYVSTTGLDDTSRYYKWDYKEDWEFHSYFPMEVYFDADSNKVFEIPYGEENYYFCWSDYESSEINVVSTEGLSQNVVRNHLLKGIQSDNRRISYLYSIEVYQKSLSWNGYKYWETLLKNNDESGGIFAPQPNEMRGNIYCEDDPERMVLGYISLCDVKSKRIYISSDEHNIYKSADGCVQETFRPNLWYTMYRGGWRPVYYDDQLNEVYWTHKKCADCRVFGHKNKPSFWPNDDK